MILYIPEPRYDTNFQRVRGLKRKFHVTNTPVPIQIYQDFQRGIKVRKMDFNTAVGNQFHTITSFGDQPTFNNVIQALNRNAEHIINKEECKTHCCHPHAKPSSKKDASKINSILNTDKPTESKNTISCKSAFKNAEGTNESDIKLMKFEKKHDEEQNVIKQNVIKKVSKRKKKKKPLKCKYCPDVFVELSELLSHVQVHSNEKRFWCSECPKGFNYKSNLKRHNRIHTGEKPFECNFCSKKYRHGHHLKNHILKYHS